MKNKSALRLLFLANIVSGFAQGISMLAIPWYFTSVIGKPGLFGWIYGLVTLSTIFWSLYSGTLVDRFPRKNIFLFTSLAGGLIVGSVSLYGFVSGAVPLGLVVLVFTTTIYVYNVHYPTLYAFGQELTDRADYMRVNSYIEIQGQSTSVVSGAFAAILLSGTDVGIVNILGMKIHLPFDVKAWELHEIFLMDAITYFIAISLIVFIRYIPAAVLNIDKGNIIKRLKSGYEFLRERPLIFIFGNASYAIFVIIMVLNYLLLPLYVDDHLKGGADIYASAEIYFAAGALLSGIFIRRITKGENMVRSVIIMMGLATIVLGICAFNNTIWVLYIVTFVMGLTNAGARILRISYLFNHIPNNIIGRTSGVFHVFNILFRSFFLLLFALPFFSKDSHVTIALFVCSLFVLISLVPLVWWYGKLTRGNTIEE